MKPSKIIRVFLVTMSIFHISSTRPISFEAAAAKPKVFVLFLDGVPHDVFAKSEMPNLIYLSSHGARVERLIPVYPTLTWPTTWTFLTGMHPESHGLVSNAFYDPLLDKIFDGSFNTLQLGLAQPIYVTNALQGGESFYEENRPPNNNWTLFSHEKVADTLDVVFSKLAANESKANLAMFYVGQPDYTEHEFGWDSLEFKEQAKRIDAIVLGRLMRNAWKYPHVNLVIVSDHGFTQIDDPTKRVFIEDYLSPDKHFVTSDVAGAEIWPRNGASVQEIKQNLTALAETGNYFVFLKHELPERLHYRNNDRIAPVHVLSKTGWLVFASRRSDYQWSKGSHGYDNEEQQMHAILVGYGPAFVAGVTLPPLSAVNVYSLIAHLAGVKPNPSNGTIAVFKNVLRGQFDITPKRLPACNSE